MPSAAASASSPPATSWSRAEAAHFALSEVKLGIVAATISPHLVRAMGARQAARYMLTAEKFTASQARDARAWCTRSR